MSEKKKSGPRPVEADKMQRAAEHSDVAIDHAYALAMSECVDPSGFDPEPMLARADGTELSPEQGSIIDEHLTRCMHCRLALREYHKTRIEHAERPETEKAAAFEALLVQAQDASCIGIDTREGPGPELNLVPPTLLQRLPWSRIVPATGLLAAAAVALLLISSPVDSNFAAIEIADLQGMSMARMGNDQPAVPVANKSPSPAIYAPDASVQLTIRTKALEHPDQGLPKIFGYFEKRGKLVALPADTLVKRHGDASWLATEWRVPVRTVLGAQPGARRLLYAATLSHDEGDFVGMTPDEAKSEGGVQWVEQNITVVEPK